jgi:hypothetical protein
LPRVSDQLKHASIFQPKERARLENNEILKSRIWTAFWGLGIASRATTDDSKLMINAISKRALSAFQTCRKMGNKCYAGNFCEFEPPEIRILVVLPYFTQPSGPNNPHIPLPQKTTFQAAVAAAGWTGVERDIREIHQSILKGKTL